MGENDLEKMKYFNKYMTDPLSRVSWLERLLGLTSSPGLPSSASDLLGTANGLGVEDQSSRTGELSSDWLGVACP